MILLVATLALVPALQEKPVTVVRPERRDLVHSIRRPVTAAPYARATLLGRVTGYVGNVAVEEGDTVKGGEVLARIEVPDLRAEVEIARAAVLEGDAALAVAGASLEERRAEESLHAAEARWWERESMRIEGLHAEGASTEQARDEVASRLETARARAEVARAKAASAEAGIRAAEARLVRARAEVTRLETLVAFAEVRAPYPRTLVARRLVDPGALAKMGETALFEVVDAERIRLRTDVSEPDAPSVSVGTPARISGLPGDPIEAAVTRTAGVLDVASRTLRIEIEVENASRRILPGAFLEAHLEVERREKALTIPVAALVTTGGRTRIFVVASGRADLREVKTGLDDATTVEILDGLSPEDSVVVGGKERLSAGDAVRIGSTEGGT